MNNIEFERTLKTAKDFGTTQAHVSILLDTINDLVRLVDGGVESEWEKEWIRECAIRRALTAFDVLQEQNSVLLENNRNGISYITKCAPDAVSYSETV